MTWSLLTRSFETRERQYCGFTLIELLVTMAILAVLATLVLPLAEMTSRRYREHELRLALREIRFAIDAYKKASDEGRIKASLGESGYPKSLDELVVGVRDERDPRGGKLYFLRSLPRDPMVADATLPAAQTWATRSYASSHTDPQPGDDVFDLYSRHPGVALNGIPYREF